jgi:stage II sporulation protein D
LLGGRGYRGSLRVKTTGSALEVVNVVGLESYVMGVVPSEMPNKWPAEALASQAVAARTYALSHLAKGGDYDLYPDTRSQVYGGIGAEAASSNAAVSETANQILLYDGKPADTFFSSSSGGKTANVQDVWSSPPVPYLVSVPDPYDTLSPYHNWGPFRFSSASIARRFHVPGKVTDFRANVSPSGRVGRSPLSERTARRQSPAQRSAGSACADLVPLWPARFRRPGRRPMAPRSLARPAAPQGLPEARPPAAAGSRSPG